MLGEPVAGDGPGLAEGAPYFATVAAFGGGLTGTPLDDVEALVRSTPGARAAGGALARGGVIVRCLAQNAPALGDAVERLWAVMRRRLLGYPSLTLRKL